MSKIHALNPSDDTKTRCGLRVEDSIVRNITDNTLSACKRCLINIKWEETNEPKTTPKA